MSKRKSSALKMAVPRHNILKLVISGEEVPRLASLKLAEIDPFLRSLLLPLRGREEWDAVFREGYLEVFRELARRGHADVLEDYDLMTLLRQKHFAFADWAIANLRVRGNAALSFLVDFVWGYPTSWEAFEWMEKHFDLKNYISRESLCGGLDENTYRRALKKYINTPNFDPRLARLMARTFHFGAFAAFDLPRELARGEYNENARRWLKEEGYMPS